MSHAQYTWSSLSLPDTYSQKKFRNGKLSNSARYLVLPHFQTPLPRQLFISMLWKFSNERQGQDAWYWTMIILTRSIVYSFPAFLRVLFLEFKALARILFLADLAFLSLNLRERFTLQESDQVWAAPVQICEAGPLSLDSHPLGPGGVGPGLVNLKCQSAFVRKAWKEGLVELITNLMWSCLYRSKLFHQICSKVITLLATSSALTILVGALKGNFTAIGVSCSCLMGYA